MADGDQSNRKVLRLVLVVLVAIILIITALVFLRGDKQPTKERTEQPNAQAVATLFIRDVLVTDAPSSYERMTERLQEQLINEATWRRSLVANFSRSNERTKIVEDREVDGQGNPKPQRIVYEVTSNFNSRRVELVLRRVDGSWKVDEFSAPRED